MSPAHCPLLPGHRPVSPILTSNASMLQVLADCQRVAPTSYPVLIQGETGSGKELLAKEVHAASGRQGSLVAVNCGAIPENLFEAELFGAKRGAYTGLDSDRRGLFRVAQGGTLFLDEIGEIPLSVQAKLLRVLQDGEIRPLGSSVTEVVDARIVLATHQDLQKMVEERSFRMDLYYRISAFSVSIPPVRERPEDIRPLLELAIAEAARQQGVPAPTIAAKVFEMAQAYKWPGNVREVFHAAAGAVLRARGGVVDVADFPVLDRRQRPSPQANPLERPFFEALAQFEREYLTALLLDTRGNLSRAAEKAQLSRSALSAKVRQYGLRGEASLKQRRRVRWPVGMLTK